LASIRGQIPEGFRRNYLQARDFITSAAKRIELCERNVVLVSFCNDTRRLRRRRATEIGETSVLFQFRILLTRCGECHTRRKGTTRFETGFAGSAGLWYTHDSNRGCMLSFRPGHVQQPLTIGTDLWFAGILSTADNQLWIRTRKILPENVK